MIPCQITVQLEPQIVNQTIINEALLSFEAVRAYIRIKGRIFISVCISVQLVLLILTAGSFA